MMNLAKDGLFSAIVLAVVAVIGLGGPLLAQQQLDPSMVYERLMAVVPIIGAGTYEDPRRPAYVPDYLLNNGKAEKAADPNADAAAPIDAKTAKDGPSKAPPVIVGFTYELSDDGQFALITFQATDSEAFAPMLEAAKTPGSATEGGPNRNALDGGFDLKVFEVGKADPASILAEFKRQKRTFSLDKLEVTIP